MSRAKLYERAFGFSFLWAWSFLTFFSTLVHFSTRNDIEHLNSTYSFAQLGAFLVLVGFAAFSQRIARSSFFNTLQILAPIIMAASTFTLMLVEAQWFTQPWCSIVSSLAGGALGIVLLGWAEVFESQDSHPSVIVTITAFFFAALIFALVLLLPLGVARVIVIILPFLSSFILFRARRQEKTPFLLAHIEIKKLPFMIKAMLSFGLLAFGNAFISAVFLEVSPVEDAALYPWAFLMAMTCSLIVMGIVFLVLKRFDIKISYRLSLFLGVLIILVLPLFDGQAFLQSVLSLVLHCAFAMLFWIILVNTTRSFHLSAIVVFGFGLGMVYCGSLAGTFFGSLAQPFVIHDVSLLHICAIGCAFIILFAYFFLFDERQIVKMSKDEPTSSKDRYLPVEDDSFLEVDGKSKKTVKSGFGNRCEKVAGNYALTPREAEVMTLLAKGRSSPRIQEELNIAPGTVNVHISKIYKKLDVHSRQDLIDLLDGKNKAKPVSQTEETSADTSSRVANSAE